MNKVTVIGFVFLFTLFILAPVSVSAQHACVCTSTCSRSCTRPSCLGTCNNACAIGSVAPLTYSGNGLVITLDWANAANSSAYELIVRNSSGTIVHQRSALTVSNSSFTAVIGQTYSWTVRAYNSCYNGTAVAGPSIGVPNTSTVTLAVDESQACSNNSCNGHDLLVGLDSNRNQLVPIRATAADSNGGANISNLNVIFDNDNSDGNGFFYGINYSRNADGTYQIVEEPTSTVPNLNITSSSAVVSGNTLTVNFSLDVSNLIESEYFLTNIYVNTRDFSNIGTGRVLKIGTGDTQERPADPYNGNAVNALDVWNGRDVAVSNVGFYQVDNYLDVCNQASADWNSLPAIGSINLEVNYTAVGDWLTNLTSWNTSTHYQPYYYYNNQNYQATYVPGADASISLRGMSSEQYGGPCVEQNSGSVISNFKNGGVRVEDSGVGDRSKQTAFAVVEIADSWSRIVDGSLFSDSNFILGIEPTICSDCVLMDTLNSENNGLLLVNGNLEAKNNVNYGKTQDWYAQSQSGINPFNDLDINLDFDQIQALYEPGTYTVLDGTQIIENETIGSEPIINNHTFFVNGDLIIADSTSLQVTEGEYLLFVVNGNLTISSAVKDSNNSNNPAVEAMFIVLGNITIQDDESDYDDNLTIEGSLIAKGNISFQRSLYSNNNIRPSVTVIFRPDMLGRMSTDQIGIINLQKSLVSQY